MKGTMAATPSFRLSVGERKALPRKATELGLFLFQIETVARHVQIIHRNFFQMTPSFQNTMWPTSHVFQKKDILYLSQHEG